ncbi:hypothetical protein D9757_000177 [Collybiopsis confluens]|uniref:Uncharacterized protein n=1 Tax=Collybiopsis confluens TaxID=2823264 RepID=A0A8H5MGL7_9AGAR|nr:hypothetical protein D9757_000177 [Collybiopsis confluens]
MTCTRHAARILLLPRTATFATSAPRLQSKKSPYTQWYSDVAPAMVPVFLLGSAVYLGLQLAQTRLSHEKHMVEAMERVQNLEAEIDALQQSREKAPILPVSSSKRRFW